jgi:DNA polymerase III gamma/tau subunit
MMLKKLLFIALFSQMTSALAASFTLDANSLDGKNNEPFYQTQLPLAVYEYTLSNNLSDLSITNAANEQIPYAIVPYENLHANTSTREEIKPLTIYKLQTEALNKPNELRIQLEKSAGKTSLDVISSESAKQPDTVFLVDAGAKHSPLRKLIVDWSGSNNIFLNTEILSSDDLQNWTAVGNAVLLNTITDTNNQQLGQIEDQKHVSPQTTKLLQNTISLNEDVSARYLQIRTTESAGSFKINNINAHYQYLQNIAAQPLWQSPKLLAREEDATAGLVNIDYETTGRYPVSRFRVILPQENMVTNVQVLVRNQPNEPWRNLTSAFIRSLKQDKNLPPESLINTTVARYWRLQFKQSDGGIGAENPALSLGWLPPTVVWNARGAAPYQLHVGNNPALVNTIAIGNMLPGFDSQKLNKLPIATPKLLAETINKNAAETNAWAKKTDYKSWILWAVLVIGVLLLAGMAYSLLQQTKK